jgi:hypothetical protein
MKKPTINNIHKIYSVIPFLKRFENKSLKYYKDAIEKHFKENNPDFYIESNKAIAITGNSYPVRKKIKYEYGGKWDKDQKAWIVPYRNKDAVEIFAKEHGLKTNLVDTEKAFFAPGAEQIREQRKRQKEDKAEKLREKAQRFREKADKIEKSIPNYMKDYAYLTQPLMPGHHSYNRHKKQREWLSKKTDEKMRLLWNADDLEKKADSIERGTPPVKGDAAKKLENEQEDKYNWLVNNKKIGDTINTVHYGKVILEKINKKSIIVKSPNSKTSLKLDIQYVEKSK